MKDIIKTFTVTTVAIALLTCGAAAQSTIGALFAGNASMPSTSDIGNGKGLPGNHNSLSDIHPYAIDDFQKSFKHVFKVKWSKSNYGYFASFTLDSVQTRVDYNRKGRWLETISYYNKKKLPDDVKYLLKSVYRHDDIVGVTEISSYHNPIYIVHIQHESYIKEVSVYDGEIQEIQNDTRRY